MAFHVVVYLQSFGANCVTPSFAKQEESIQALRAAASIQPKRGVPKTVSEFREILPRSRVLSILFRGYIASAGTEQGFQHDQIGNQQELTSIGIQRSPSEFVHEALHIGRPVEVNALFPNCIRRSVDAALSVSHEALARAPAAELRRWALFAEDLKPKESELKGEMSERTRKVLENKRMCLFEQLIAARAPRLHFSEGLDKRV